MCIWPPDPIVSETFKSQESQGKKMVLAIFQEEVKNPDEIQWFGQFFKDKVRNLREIKWSGKNQNPGAIDFIT